MPEKQMVDPCIRQIGKNCRMFFQNLSTYTLSIYGSSICVNLKPFIFKGLSKCKEKQCS
jgi:hypothetical protein